MLASPHVPVNIITVNNIGAAHLLHISTEIGSTLQSLTITKIDYQLLDLQNCSFAHNSKKLQLQVNQNQDQGISIGILLSYHLNPDSYRD